MRFVVPAMLAASAIAGPAQALPARSDAAPVVEAEHAFAARAAEVGISTAFLDFMADEAIVFAPDPVNARTVYSGRPPSKAPKDGGTRLAWWPNFAGLARSEDLGFTTGPATVNGGKPAIFYFTVWARQSDNSWKWLYDGGPAAEGANTPGPGVAPAVMLLGDANSIPASTAMAQVKAAEVALTDRASIDVIAAYAPVLLADTWMLGSGGPPAATAGAVARELAARARAIDFAPLGGSASRAGDLAWTYGDARWVGGRGHYVRIWQRRDGAWRLVFDQLIEVPPPAAG